MNWNASVLLAFDSRATNADEDVGAPGAVVSGLGVSGFVNHVAQTSTPASAGTDRSAPARALRPAALADCAGFSDRGHRAAKPSREWN